MAIRFTSVIRLGVSCGLVCPAGARAACAAGGHFVACIPVSAGLDAGGLALLGLLDDFGFVRSRVGFLALR